MPIKVRVYILSALAFRLVVLVFFTVHHWHQNKSFILLIKCYLNSRRACGHQLRSDWRREMLFCIQPGAVSTWKKYVFKKQSFTIFKNWYP